jgi:pimeloyl-ACP methyl ester carboxylesterase
VKAQAHGIDIEYDVHGRDSDPPMLLIMGLSAQLTMWREEFVDELVGQGYQVIRFDNRDIGLSTWFDHDGVPDLAGAMATGQLPPAVYSLDDMADDAAGLLDALGIERAHIVGASMGGMIAQTFAIRHPGRTISLCSIMSTTGNRDVGQSDPAIVQQMFMSVPPSTAEEAESAGLLATRVIGSPGYPADEQRVRAYARAAFIRAFHPDGVARQTLAVIHQPDRTDALQKLDVPTLVIHGEADPLVAPSGGRATAEAVPGADLWMQPGVGHDIPPALYAETAERIAANCRRAELDPG